MISLGTSFDELLVRGATGVLCAAGVWALAIATAVVLEARSVRARGLAERLGCPPVVRAWLLALCVAVVAAAPARASDHGAGDPGSSPGGRGAALDGLPLPDRAAGARGPRDLVVVRPGDCLWRIARGLLPQGARDSAVAQAVHRIHAANRSTIGPDPDRLTPGQRLRAPTRTSSSRPTTPTTPTEAP